MKFSIRLLYLYLFSFVGLLITVIGTVRLVDLGLKVYVFQNADTYVSYPRMAPLEGKPVPEPSREEEEKLQKQETQRQRQRTAAEALSMIAVGLPLYLYHWRIISKTDRKS